MMKDYISLESVPYNEVCAQVADPEYIHKSSEELKRYKTVLLNLFKKEHNRDPKCSLKRKGHSHDFGTYYEIVAEFDFDDDRSVDDAFWLESNLPANWPKDVEK